MSVLGIDSTAVTPSGKTTNALFSVLGRNPNEFNCTISGDGNRYYTAVTNDVTVEIHTPPETELHLTHTEAKMLYAILSGFDPHKEMDTLYIQETTYYRLCGYAVIPKIIDDTNPAPGEITRISHIRWKARQAALHDLQVLSSIRLTFLEELRDSLNSRSKVPMKYTRIRLIKDWAISDGLIRIEFSTHFVNYISKLPLRQFSPLLLSVSAKRPYSFQIGYKLINNYHNRIAITQGHRDCLAVSTILAACSLPTFDQVKEKRKSWKSSDKGGLKVPFEKALDELVTCGVISSWTYEIGKIPVSHRYFSDYYLWISAKIRYTRSPQNDIA